MSIIPVICHNYLANSRRLREEDNNSYHKNTNCVYGDRTIPCSLNPEGFASIFEYREACHKLQKKFEKFDKSKGGGIRL